MAVEAYLQHAISLPLMDVTDLCAFLSSNVIDKSSYTKVSVRIDEFTYQSITP